VARNLRFRSIVCFQELDRGFISPFSGLAAAAPTGAATAGEFSSASHHHSRKFRETEGFVGRSSATTSPACRAIPARRCLVVGGHASPGRALVSTAETIGYHALTTLTPRYRWERVRQWQTARLSANLIKYE